MHPPGGDGPWGDATCAMCSPCWLVQCCWYLCNVLLTRFSEQAKAVVSQGLLADSLYRDDTLFLGVKADLVSELAAAVEATGSSQVMP